VQDGRESLFLGLSDVLVLFLVKINTVDFDEPLEIDRALRKERIFNLRVPNDLVEKIDALRKAQTGKISRNTWIPEAIEDKIEKELS
jgi:hypothetical protein